MVRQHPARSLWEARYVGADGRRHSLYAKTRKQAQERLRGALIDADHGIRPIGQRLTVAAYLTEWVETSVTARCRPRTVASYRETAARYIVPAIGTRALASLQPEDVQRMLSHLTARGDLSPTTVRYAYVVLRIALGRALKTGRVSRNVCTLVDPPAKTKTEVKTLTASEVREFLASIAHDPLYPLFLTAIATGLRQGELLALSWADVDTKRGTLTVRHTLQQGTKTLAEPKTERAKRTLPLPAQVREVLAAHRTRGGIDRLDGFVFETSIRTPLDSRRVTRDFQAKLERAGLRRQRFHDLRHAYTVLMLEAGEELSVVSRTLGHANLSTTADIYGGLSLAMGMKAADRMDGILADRRAG